MYVSKFIDKKIYEPYIDEDNKLHVGYSIGIVYTKNPERENCYKLYNLGFLPEKNIFYYNRNIHIDKRILTSFELPDVNNRMPRLFKRLGILEKKETDLLIKEYYEKKRKQ